MGGLNVAMSETEFSLALVHDAVAGAVPDREAIVFGDLRMTHRELADRSARLGRYLAGRGLGIGTERPELAGHQSGQDHLAIYLYNGSEYVEAMLGAFKARVAPFNVNYRYVKDELTYLLRDSGARAIVYHAAFAPTLAEVLTEVPGLDVLIQVADDSGNDLLPGAVEYEAALAAGEGAEGGGASEGRVVSPGAAGASTGSIGVSNPDDLYILYTGGTTGMPKGVLWRQHDIFVAAMGGRGMGSADVLAGYEAVAERAAASPPVKFLVLPPLMHGAAQWVCFSAFNSGGTVVFPRDVRRLDPADVWHTAERESAMILSIVGDAMARPLVDELDKGGYQIETLFSIISGGAPLNPALKERLTEHLPKTMIMDAVGSSETGAQMSHVSTHGSVATGQFRPGPGTVVLDEGLTTILEPGHDGIGWLAQTGFVPLGYLGDAGKTARTFPVVGGVRYAVPGDRARLLEDGAIELLGRDSVTINSGGEKIFAEEVERAIGSHPDVADVMVVGRASERWGQEVVALVQRADGSSVTPEQLTEHASASLARYKLPKDVHFLPALVRSPSGKADYRWAAEQARSLAPDPA